MRVASGRAPVACVLAGCSVFMSLFSIYFIFCHMRLWGLWVARRRGGMYGTVFLPFNLRRKVFTSPRNYFCLEEFMLCFQRLPST